MVIDMPILMSQQNGMDSITKELFCVSAFLILILVCLILETEFPFSCRLSLCLAPSPVCRLG
jgi:hypothetical protein